MSELTLYGITEEILKLDEILEKDAGEITDEYLARLNEITPLLTKKVDGCVGNINREKDLIKAAKDRITALRDFIKAKETKIENFNIYVAFCLEKTGEKSFDGELHQIKLRKPSQVVEILNENKLPGECIIVETITKIDKKKVKELIKNGEMDTGVARLIDGKISVILGLKK